MGPSSVRILKGGANFKGLGAKVEVEVWKGKGDMEKVTVERENVKVARGQGKDEPEICLGHKCRNSKWLQHRNIYISRCVCLSD